MRQLNDIIASPLVELLTNHLKAVSFQIFSKLLRSFQSLKLSQCRSFLEQQNCFYNVQFGFWADVPMLITENIESQVNQNKFRTGVYVDLRKAFDTVDHEILLKKLSHYGIRRIAKWFCSYLTKRKQYVVIGNQVSTLNEISRISIRTSALFYLHK